MILRHLSLLFCTLLGLSSCLTGDIEYRNFKKAPLFGMVYDHDNQPCGGAQIILDDKEGPQTDINGRFAVNSVTRGEHQIRVRKDGFEELTVTFEFLNRSQVLYLRAISYHQLLRRAEAALGRKRWHEADQLLERAQAVREDEPVGMYLRALYLLEVERVGEAVSLLNQIIAKGYPEAVVYLTLADIHQYRLDDRQKVVSYLEQYLKIQGNPEVKRRREELLQSESLPK